MNMEPNFRLTLAQCQTAAWCFGQPCRQAGQRYEDVPIHSPQTVAAQVWLHTFGVRWWHLPEANQATEVEMQALVASVFVHVKKSGAECGKVSPAECVVCMSQDHRLVHKNE